MFTNNIRSAKFRTVVAAGCLILSLGLEGCSGSAKSRAAQHLARGEASYSAKDYRRAAIEFKVASQNAPEDPEPLYRLALAQIALKDGRGAIQTCEKVLALKSDHEGALYQMARMRAAANVPELLNNGADYLNKILSVNPSNAPALYAMAAIQVKLNKPEDALRTYGRALASRADQLDDVRLPISAAAGRGDTDLARQFVLSALARLPKSPELAAISAELAIQQKELPLARTEVARALALKPGFVFALELRMRLEDAAGEPERAEATARELTSRPDAATRTAYAAVLLAHGKADKAVQEYARLHAAFPAEHATEDVWIDLMIRTRRGEEARTALKNAIGKDPKHGESFLLLARLAIDEGRLAEAGEALQSVDRLGYFNENVSFEKFRYHAARGERTRGGDMLNEALQRNPRMLKARLQLSRLLAEAGKPEIALKVLDDATEPEKTTPEYSLYRNTALMAAGEWGQARAAVNAKLPNGRTPDLVLQDAALRIHEHDLPGAERSLRGLLADNPGNTVALAEMAAIFQARHQSKEYLVWLNGFAERNSAVPPLQIYTAGILRTGGDLSGARKAISRAEANGAHRESEVESSILDLAEGKLESARTRLLEAVRLHDDFYLRTLLADAFQRTGDWLRAEENLRAATRLAPGEWLPLMNLAAVIAHDPKRMEEAMLYAEKALTLSPGNPAVENAVGRMYYDSGRYAQAVNHLEVALRNSDSASTRYKLAAACLKIGDVTRARAEYDAAVKLNANDGERAATALLIGSAGS